MISDEIGQCTGHREGCRGHNSSLNRLRGLEAARHDEWETQHGVEVEAKR